jgi:hypothetical protein
MMKAWDAFLNGKYIDTVFFSESFDHEYVKKSLVEHDGMNPDIKVYERPL